MNQSTMLSLLQRIARCDTCLPDLPQGARPIVQASSSSRILIIGQAPGKKVHETGVPWNDPSGDQLRRWLGVDKTSFYDDNLFAFMPMGFCYPGKGKNGDLPPRKECAPQWHRQLLKQMPDIQLTLLIGLYAQNKYLENSHRTLTENVINHAIYLPEFLPLPHPSPRNRIWQHTNPWFVNDVLPVLQAQVNVVLQG